MVAWEWVAPVAAASGGIVGAVTTYLTARAGRRHAETITHLSHNHAAELARVARVQERYSAAYIELLTITKIIGDWCQNGHLDPSKDEPRLFADELLPVADRARQEALAKGFGSDAVNSLVEAHRDKVSPIIISESTLRVIYLRKKHFGDSESVDLELKQVRERVRRVLRPAELAARRKLESQVATELRSTKS